MLFKLSNIVILIWFLLSLSNAGASQSEECDTNWSLEDKRTEYSSLGLFVEDATLDGYDPIPGQYETLKLSIHLVTDGVDILSQTDLDQALLELQQGFDQVQFQFTVFHQCTVEVSDPVLGLMEQEDISAQHNIPATINIYYTAQDLVDQNGGAARGLATFSPPHMVWFNNIAPTPDCHRNQQYIFIENGHAPTTTTPHEVGHYFDLWHINSEALGTLATVPEGDPSNTGDLISDTPETHLFNPECDAGDPDLRELARNYMSGSSPGNECREVFTTRQIQKMRYVLFTRRPELLEKEPIQLSNIIDGNDAAEMLEATQNSQTYTVNSGDWVALTRNENASIKTLSERYENWQGSGITYKHHDWNENFSRHLLNETILVQPNANQSAWFEEIQPAEINNYLLTTGASNVGQIDFHNPWFVESDGSQPDDFLPFSLPYSPTGARDSTTGGVFLDQPFTGNNPHYRVRALEQQINGVIYFLESWSGSNVTFEDNQAEETAVVFQQANATLTAHMKGRRASNTPEATAGNNSRKVIGWWNEASEPFLVYQDYGNIYHAIQADGEWYKDYRQSEGLPGMIYQQPSLYLLHDARSAFTSLDEVIVWDEYDPARERHNLKTSEFPDFPIVDYNNPYPPHPSVAGYVVAPYENPESGTRTAVVAFRGGFQYSSPESSLDGIRLWFTRDGVVHFLNLTSSADYPAIECRKETNYNGSIEPYYQLAWQEEQGIQYLEFDRDNDTGSEVNFYAETILNDDDPLLKDNRHPSIHSDWESGNPANTYVYVVWEALQENGSVEKLVAPITHRGLNCPPASLDVPVFCFREKQNSQWGTLNVFQVNNTCDRKPVVISWQNGNERDCAIAYEGKEGEVHYILRQQGEWGNANVLTTDGNNPSLAAMDNAPYAIWTEFNASPYRIQYNDALLTPLESGSAPPHSRRISFNLRESLTGGNQLPVNGDVILEIADPELTTAAGSQKIKPMFRDSLLTPANGFVYNNILVNQANPKLRIPVGIKVLNLIPVNPTESETLELPILRVQIRDAGNQQVLQTLHTFNSGILPSDSLSYFSVTDTFELDLSHFVGKTIRFEGRTFFNKFGVPPQFAEVYDLRRESSQQTAPMVSGDQETQTPSDFSLSQNYPNPICHRHHYVIIRLPQSPSSYLKILRLS